jgi:cob(I)alamin adenosyltransferase
MGNRLSKITTRTGDSGTTGLGDGTRRDKDDLRIEVIGEIDELNSFVGCILTETLSSNIRDILVRIQHDLFDLGGEIAIPGSNVITMENLTRLETYAADFTEQLPPLKEFILPGGNPAASFTHIARAISRRVERKLFSLSKVEAVNSFSLKYLNRLSDLLFQLSRIINQEAGISTVYWQSTRSKS